MISWIVRSLALRAANVVLKIHKTLIRPHKVYCTQVWATVSRHGNWSVILILQSIQRRMTKLIKRVKDYSYGERLKILGLTNLLERMRGDLIKTSKIINGISNYGRLFSFFFNISPRTGNLPSGQVLKIKSTSQLDFLANRVICFWKILPNQIKNSNSVKRSNCMISEIMVRKII